MEPGTELVSVKIRELKADLAMEHAMPSAPRSLRSDAAWTMIFYPDDFWEEHKHLTLEGCRLKEAKLISYGKQLTKMRAAVRAEAERHQDSSIFNQQEAVDRVYAFAAKM